MSGRVLRRAAESGTWADLRHRDVDADVLRTLCRTGDVDPRGVMVRRARVTGRLDLGGVELRFPLRFEDCDFAEAPLFDGAGLHELALSRCRLPHGLRANGLRVARDLDLSGSRIAGALWTTASTTKQSAIWLCEAEIGGRLLCVGTVVRPDGRRAIHADRLRVAGPVRMIDGFTADGEVRLIGAHIDGTVDLSGARIGRPGQLALDLAETVIGGSLFLIEEASGRTPVIAGRLDMGAVRIAGQLIVRAARIGSASDTPLAGPYPSSRSGGTAIHAPRAAVSGDVSFQGACHVQGGVDLSMGDFGHIQFDGDCVLDAPGRTALDLANAELRSSLVLREGVRVAGTVSLDSASIRGHLTLRGVRLSRPEGKALLSARAVRVEGDVEAQRLDADGGDLTLRGAVLNNNLDLDGATLSNPDRITVRLHHATVRGSVRLTNGFTSRGRVLLTRSVIDGRLDLRGGTFVNGPDAHAVEAEAVVAGGGMYLGWARVRPSVDFTDSRTTILADDPETWPPRFLVRGLTYERFGQLDPGSSNWAAPPRIAWLARQSAFDAGPYEQAARVFRQHGHQSAAEEVLISQRRHARQAATDGSRLRALADRLYGLFGYGYRPGRAGWPLVLLLLAVFVFTLLPAGAETLRATDPRGNVYAPSGRLVTTSPVGPPSASDVATPATTPPRADPCGDGQIRCFNAFFYAVDTVVPLVSLGQRSTWYPDPHTAWGRFSVWFLDCATLLGWALSSILVLSFARLARNV